MYNTKTRFILSLLVFLMIFNFTFEYKARAEAIALSAGFILFLKACYAAGITYIAGQKVAKVTQESMDLYKEWQKFIENKPPEDKPPKDWEKTVLGTLLGLQVGDSFKRLVNSVKDFFNELGAKEGKNEFYGLGTVIDIIDKKQSMSKTYYGVKEVGYTVSLFVAGYGMTYTQHGGDKKGYTCHYSGGEVYDRKGNRGASDSVSLRVTFYSDNVALNFNNGVDSNTVRVPISSVPPEKPPTPSSIEYNFEPNSYQFTGNSDDIKPVYPNLSNFPQDKLVTVTNPNGSIYTYYPGTFDELFNDWVNSQNKNNIFGNKPLELTETENGIKFEDNFDTLPYDPNAPVETPSDVTTGLGTIIQLLKELINWSSNIFNKIPEEGEPIPEPEPDEDLLKLPEKVELDFSPLQGLLLTDRFPFCLPWDLKRSVEKLISPGAPPRWEVEIVTEEIVIDFAEFEALASISRAFFGLIYVGALVIITRRFISGA